MGKKCKECNGEGWHNRRVFILELDRFEYAQVPCNHCNASTYRDWLNARMAYRETMRAIQDVDKVKQEA
jgi:excinuclease UvrABC ATPase subunit